ncbi:malonate decarboxylase subunit epsilon [Desmospora activa]|uniref:Malonyl CoA-acyl carrier protein transacylase n=1 Tax=Desmospora activa DSM 45169 TaxID=1121389 RepID=A0A2T4Z4N5_9BACL|nr:malonate decarboxylase subunit epsilon [Desmospora activa]PTM56858.1 malonate decarboxylase epsilon subunit [Desmospora activa DSM 45169]
MRVAYQFPGQGSQYPGMLRHLPDHPAVARTLVEAGEVLEENVRELDRAERLSSTTVTQVCLLIAGVATARVLMEEGAIPDAVAGHSVGAFGAAVTAGVLDFRDALQMVRLRGCLMEEAYPRGYGMGVVTGMGEQRLLSLVESVQSPDDPVYPANFNACDQIVIAGSITGLEQVFAAAFREGARQAHLLDVSVPSHCPLLKGVSKRLAAALDDITVREPRMPFAGNRRGRLLRRAEVVKEDLALGVSHPVRWFDATSLLVEVGVRLYVEMPPGSVLTRLATNAFPEVRSLAVDDSGVRSAAILTKRIQKEA